MHKPYFSVVIPVYKNVDMVIRNLKHNEPFFKGCEVILVDDASGGTMVEQLRELFPEYTLIENSRNMGFGPTVNAGVKQAKTKFVILLGSDVRLIHPFPHNLLDTFQSDPHLFSISFRQRERDGSSMGKNRIYFRRGLPNHEKTHDLDAGQNAWADGGSSIMRKSMFDALGGFQDLYAPFYWEDIDLSFRAMSRGWHIKFDPELFVEHHHESTIGSLFTKKHITTIAYRNQFLFTWSAITDAGMIAQHLALLPYYLLRFALRGDSAFIQGFLKAVLKLPRVYAVRQIKRKYEVVSDRKIFDAFAQKR